MTRKVINLSKLDCTFKKSQLAESQMELTVGYRYLVFFYEKKVN
jgi:hypothetical protein